MKEQIVQGDLLFEKLETYEGTSKEARERQKLPTNVIAYGEKSGHKHVLTGGFLWGDLAAGSMRMFVEDGGGTVAHEEHAPAPLSPGQWSVKRQRTQDYRADYERALNATKLVVD